MSEPILSSHRENVINFGCRLNAFESEVIKNNLNLIKDKNLFVVNTCAVTKEAEKQARQAIRKIKKNNKDARIIVTGCSAQIDPKKYESMPEVDKIIGNNEKLDPNYYNLENQDSKISVNNIMEVKEFSPHLLESFDSKTRAFVQIQNGCNHRCTFCIIPYGRGNSRSAPIGEIARQIEILLDNNYQEIVLTGVDIGDYGQDLPGTPNLGHLIHRLFKLFPKLPRLRISSIDVAEFDENLWHLLKEEMRFMPHLHLSLQSGDNMILKRMKRRHTREQVLEFCEKARNIRPNIAFGADIITGFPTEDELMFRNTVNLVLEANLQYLHVFPYSIREGTPAAKMPQVATNICKERAKYLISIGQKQMDLFLRNLIGTQQKMIVEKENFARCENFAYVKLQKQCKIGDIIESSIQGIEGEHLIAAI